MVHFVQPHASSQLDGTLRPAPSSQLSKSVRPSVQQAIAEHFAFGNGYLLGRSRPGSHVQHLGDPLLGRPGRRGAFTAVQGASRRHRYFGTGRAF